MLDAISSHQRNKENQENRPLSLSDLETSWCKESPRAEAPSVRSPLPASRLPRPRSLVAETLQSVDRELARSERSHSERPECRPLLAALSDEGHAVGEEQDLSQVAQQVESLVRALDCANRNNQELIDTLERQLGARRSAEAAASEARTQLDKREAELRNVQHRCCLTEREKEAAVREIDSERRATEDARKELQHDWEWFADIAALVGAQPVLPRGPAAADGIRDVQRLLRDRLSLVSATESMESTVATASLENARLTDLCQRLQAEVRALKNQLQELRGHVRVFVRFPPPSKVVGTQCWCRPSGDKHVLIKPPQFDREVDFAFDKVFPAGTSQEEVFHELRPVMESAVDGFDACVLAYGQTGTGKTYTMEGASGTPGIMQLGMELLFEKVNLRANAVVQVSILEVYNEEVRDLLQCPVPTLEVRIVEPGTALVDRSYGSVGVPGLTAVTVTSAAELHQVMAQGKRNRAEGKTNVNEHSSRSHMILTVQVRYREVDLAASVSSLGGSQACPDEEFCGRVHFVDLAGSERTKVSGAEGQRMKEAQNINKSLAALGDVLRALAKNQRHIPYRNSKLTYLLQDALGGSSKVLMFAQVSSDGPDVQESFSTLHFASRVASIEKGRMKPNSSRERSSSTARASR